LRFGRTAVAKKKTTKTASKKKRAAKKTSKKKAAAKKKTTASKRAASAGKKAKATKAKKKTAAKKSTGGAATKQRATKKKGTATKKAARKRTPARAPTAKDRPPPPVPAPQEAVPPTRGATLGKPPEKLPKTKLSAKDLQEFRELLLEKRAQIAGDVTTLSTQAFGAPEQGDEHSRMPQHLADVGSDNFEHEFTLGLIENERVVLQEIDDALERINDRTYGICLGTGKPISKARLRAKPWAKYCYEYTLELERQQGRTP
jgi:RNA polymerase-binding transcription factor DksA